MHLRLYPAQAPKAVENFVGHARSSYFEGVIFHRVIPKFMIQTGDPLGDGTGGTSIWGKGWVLKTVYCEYGKCGTWYEWITVLYHHHGNTMA